MGKIESAQDVAPPSGVDCESSAGFEKALQLVGGHNRFQWMAMCVVSLQLMLLTWNHMGYIFIGAVPDHWCHLEQLDNTSWSVEQIRNISIPKIYPDENSVTFKYDQCQYYSLDYAHLLEQSGGDFQQAYQLTHGGHNDTEKLLKRSCHSWSYDVSIYSLTIASEFDLVCGRRYLVASIQAFYMIGAFIGTLIFGPLDDKILGRRNSTLVCIVLIIVGGFLTSFANSYVMFICVRFLVAIGTAGCMQACSIWFLEHCDTKCRAKMYLIGGIFFGVGYAIMPLYAYVFRNWSHLQLAFSGTHLLLLSFFWIFPESPRWLASQGRDAEAIKALERMASINKMPSPQAADLLEAIQQCHQHHGQKDDPSRSSENIGRVILLKFLNCLDSFKSLISTKELTKISLTVWALFVTVAFVYYGFAFSTRVTSNPFLLVALGALMEIPASVLPIPFLSRWGRRPTTVACYLFTGLSSLLIAITPMHSEGSRMVLSLIGKLFVASAFTVLYLVASEVYPTVVRTTGQGAGTLMGRFGSIVAPFVADLLTTVYPDLPCVIFGVVALAGALVALLIPEMKDLDMKDQISEFEQPL